MKKSLKDAGFEVLDPTVHPRLIMSLSGHQRHGKTHFAFTAPGPICYFNLDMGEEGVIHKFFGKKDIFTISLDIPSTSSDDDIAMIKQNKEKASEVWNKFTKAYYVALKEVRTIVIDTASELWELMRLARFGRSSQVQHLYTPVNAEFKGLFHEAKRAMGANVIFLHRYKSEYVNDKFTGNYIPACFGSTSYEVQIVAHMRRTDPEEGEGGNSQFSIWIEDCKQNAEMIGKTLPGPLCNFPTLAQMVLPTTKAEDWA